MTRPTKGNEWKRDTKAGFTEVTLLDVDLPINDSPASEDEPQPDQKNRRSKKNRKAKVLPESGPRQGATAWDEARTHPVAKKPRHKRGVSQKETGERRAEVAKNFHDG